MSTTFKCLLSILIGLPTLALALAGKWLGVAVLFMLICGLFIQGGRWFRSMCTFTCLVFAVFSVCFGGYVIAQQVVYTPANCSGRRVFVCSAFNFVLTSGGPNLNGLLWILAGLGMTLWSASTLRSQLRTARRVD